MNHPLRGVVLGTLFAVILIALIPDDTLRYVLTGALVAGGWWKWHSTYAKRPLMSKHQRREMMAFHIDRGLELAKDDAERQILVAWLNAKLED